MAILPTPLLLLLTVLLTPRLATATCYAPDGKVEPNPEYVPCSNNASNPLHTICCATNRPAERGPDICAPNGLCQVGVKKGEEGKNQVAWTKPQCTKDNYGSVGCLHVCGSDSLGYLTPCDAAAGNSSRRWCCGYKDTNCCDRSDFESIFPDFSDALAAELNASSVSAAATASPTRSPTPTLSSTSSSISTPSVDLGTPVASGNPVVTATPFVEEASASGLSTGAKAGVAVGATLGALALFVGIFAVRRHLAAKKEKAGAPYSGDGGYDASGHPHGCVTYAHEQNGGRLTPVCELADEKNTVGTEVWSGKDPIEVA